MRGHFATCCIFAALVLLPACPAAPAPTPSLAPGTYLVVVEAAGKGVQATAQLVTTLTSLMATDLWITGLHAAPNVTVRDSMNASAAKGCGADAPSGESNEYAYTRWTQDVSVTQQSMPEELDRAGRRRRLHAAADHTASASSQLAHRRLQAGRAADSLAAHIRATASPAEQQLAAQAVKRHLLECTDASAAIVTLIMSLQGLQADSNYVQNQTCSLFWSGIFLNDVQKSLPAVQDLELLQFQAPGEAPVMFETSEEWGKTIRDLPPVASSVAQPPAQAADQPNVTVAFDLQLVGPDASLTNDVIVSGIYSAVLGMLTPALDYVTAQNTAVVSVKALNDTIPASLDGTNNENDGQEDDDGGAYNGRRRLLELEQGSGSGRMLLALPASQGQSAYAGGLPAAVSIVPTSDSPAAAPALQPQPSIRVSFRIANVSTLAAGVIYQRLSQIVATNMLLATMREHDTRVFGIALQNFSPNPNAPAPPPPMYRYPPVVPIGDSGPQQPPKHGMPTGYIVISVLLPVIALFVGIGLAYAWHRTQAKRRQRDIEARGSSDSEGIRKKHLLRQHSSSGYTVDGVIATMNSGPKLSAAEALLEVPWNDWEISDPDDIEIMKRKDGSEWLLGAGASGRVYKATAGGVQTVAVKIFTDQARAEACSGERAAEFRREIAILKGCRDRNIVQFIGACLQEGRTILVTEYLENGDLYNAIANSVDGTHGWYRRLQPNGRPAPGTGLARRIALDVARGLAFLHDRKVVHFDLKSANILLARDLTAKIADVGLARILHKDYLSSLREVGTFAWAAPEVLLGQQCSEKVDIYSYGVLMWELSAGEAPIGRQLRKLRIPEEAPQQIEDLMLQCLDTDPAVRPSARQIAEILSELRIPPRAPGGDLALEASLVQCEA